MSKSKDKEPSGKKPERKRISISMRIDPDLLERIDGFLAAQMVPADRTAFIETACRWFLEKVESDQD